MRFVDEALQCVGADCGERGERGHAQGIMLLGAWGVWGGVLHIFRVRVGQACALYIYTGYRLWAQVQAGGAAFLSENVPSVCVCVHAE